MYRIVPEKALGMSLNWLDLDSMPIHGQATEARVTGFPEWPIWCLLLPWSWKMSPVSWANWTVISDGRFSKMCWGERNTFPLQIWRWKLLIHTDLEFQPRSVSIRTSMWTCHYAFSQQTLRHFSKLYNTVMSKTMCLPSVKAENKILERHNIISDNSKLYKENRSILGS